MSKLPSVLALLALMWLWGSIFISGHYAKQAKARQAYNPRNYQR